MPCTHASTPLHVLTTHLKFDSPIDPIRIPPVVIMLHPLKRSMVLSSTASLVVRPSHSEKLGGKGGREKIRQGGRGEGRGEPSMETSV